MKTSVMVFFISCLVLWSSHAEESVKFSESVYVGTVESEDGKPVDLEKLEKFAINQEFDWSRVLAYCQHENRVTFLVDGGGRSHEIPPEIRFTVILGQYGSAYQALRIKPFGELVFTHSISVEKSGKGKHNH